MALEHDLGICAAQAGEQFAGQCLRDLWAAHLAHGTAGTCQLDKTAGRLP
jgi:hypothetical protein